MEWKQLLSLLRAQTPHLHPDLFLRYSDYEYLLHYPEKLYFELDPSDPLRLYIYDNPVWYHECFRLLEEINRFKINLIYIGHPDYPENLYRLANPPLFLTYRGNPAWKNKKILSVVGSRDPSPKSIEWMDLFLTEVVRENIVIASGAARGIDQRAHLTSIRMKQPTLAFLPSGLNQVYPKDFKGWMDRILDSGGAVISEYAPNIEMRKHHFLERNRMIARIGKCLFLVEARENSGSTMTARIAIENGQLVGVLPAFPLDQGYRGSLNLLFNGAYPIRDNIDLKLLIDMADSSIPDFFQRIDSSNIK